MAAMGRKPTINTNLPARMRARVQRSGKVYYYYDTGAKPRKEIPLGSDYIEAVRKWAELEGDGRERVTSILTFNKLADKYRTDVIPKKAARTQDDNLRELDKLLEYFGNPPAPIDSIEPHHIRKYLDWRTKNGTRSTTRANREKALFSHMWNKAREWGITDKPNPCLGVQGFTESGRDVYIEDKTFAAVYEFADQPTRDALDLAYLTGQRPADVLSMSEMHISDQVLQVQQGKTSKKIRMAIEGELKRLLERISERKRGLKIRTLYLICDETGHKLTYGALRGRFDKARAAAAKKYPKMQDEIKQFQYRDLRAKAGTDTNDNQGMQAAQRQLGHGSITTTEIYIRERRGDIVKPTK